MLCLLSALSLCPWCAVFEYGSISRFKAFLARFWAFRVGLCCLGALRGLCGFCTRVELGGLKACGVFAPVFIFFCPCFLLLLLCLPPFMLVVLLCSGCLLLVLLPCLVCSCVLVALWVCCCFLFPFGIYAKRKGAPCWCVLSSCVVSVQILVTLSKNSVAVALARSNSFG